MVSPTIVAMDVLDVRFPTSRNLDGSDAMNLDPDYSAAYVVVRTDDPAGPEGHGLTFTIGRGTEVVVAAVEALRPLVVGRRADELFADMGQFWRTLVGDSQLRWIGPEKGVIHLATAAVVNAVWDLFAKQEGKPLWKLLCDMSPEQQVALVDFRYISDALSPARALEPAAGPRVDARGARGGAAPHRVSGVRHLRRLARLRRRQDQAPVSRGAGRRVDGLQAQGRRQRRRRPTPGANRARGDRSRNEGLIRFLPAPLSLHVYRLVWRQTLFFLHNLVIWAVLMVIFPQPLSWTLVLAVPAFAVLVLNGAWVALLAGIVATRFRDIPPIIASLTQLLFFMTPIVW